MFTMPLSMDSQPDLPLVSCSELVDVFGDAILIDVRPFSDFVVGHISGAISIRLSSILIRRLSQGKIPFADIVAEEHKARFKCLSQETFRKVVVYDEADFDGKSPLVTVFKSLQQIFPNVAVLQGGISACRADLSHLIESIEDDRSGGLFHGTKCTEDGEHSPFDKHVRDLHPCEILPFLFVGSQVHAQSRAILSGLKITHILNITATCPNCFPNDIQYKTIPIKDTWNQNISSFFQECFEFIDSARSSDGRVLVHCVAGISRSPTITIAYLMKTTNMSLQDALSHVKGRRSIVAPNLDFLVELEAFERSLNPSLPIPPVTVSPDEPNGSFLMDCTPPTASAPPSSHPAAAHETLSHPCTPACLPKPALPSSFSAPSIVVESDPPLTPAFRSNLGRVSFGSPRGSPRSVRRDPCGASPVSPAHGIFVL